MDVASWRALLPAKMRPRLAAPDAKGCVAWLGAHQSGGYGEVWLNGRTVLTHRAVFEAVRGPLPKGLVIDHLCRNRGCCNPEHLDLVTQKENCRRGLKSALFVPPVVCLRGHSKADAYVRISKKGHIQRQCRTCARETSQAAYAARVAARRAGRAA